MDEKPRENAPKQKRVQLRRSPSVPCPVCGKMVQTRGMSGHLRFAHGRESEGPLFERKKKMETKPGNAAKREQLYKLVDELQSVRKKIKEAEESDKSFFFTDHANDAAIVALKNSRDQLAKDIARLGKEIEKEPTEK